MVSHLRKMSPLSRDYADEGKTAAANVPADPVIHRKMMRIRSDMLTRGRGIAPIQR